MKAAVTELDATKLLFRPILGCCPRLRRHYRLGVAFAQSLLRFRLQSIYEYPLHRRRLLVPGILTASALSLSHLQPIRRAITGTAELSRIDERFQQQQFIAVAFLPIGFQPPH